MNAGFGVYVHWPFCLSKCPYCDFNSHVRHAPIDEARFVRAFAAEIAATAAARAGPHGVDHLLRRRHALADAARDRRGDPRRDRAALAVARRRRGHARSQSDQRRGDAFSRLSRGRRQPRLARRAGARRCGACGARPAAYRATRRSTRSRSRARSFARYSFDLIYARPAADAARMGAPSSTRAIGEAAEHLSLYQLTIEADTPFAALHAAGKLDVPDDDDRARALRHDAGDLRGARSARLRDLQSCAARRRVPAQPRLLARA